MLKAVIDFPPKPKRFPVYFEIKIGIIISSELHGLMLGGSDFQNLVRAQNVVISMVA